MTLSPPRGCTSFAVICFCWAYFMLSLLLWHVCMCDYITAQNRLFSSFLATIYRYRTGFAHYEVRCNNNNMPTNPTPHSLTLLTWRQPRTQAHPLVSDAVHGMNVVIILSVQHSTHARRGLNSTS